MRSGAFISYSHKDKDWLDQLEVMIDPLKQIGLNIWSDTSIEPGSKWLQDISEALERATVAVLLVSPDFLTSKFIREYELPRLLDASKGLTILCVPVRPCMHEKTPIGAYHFVRSPASPLSKLSGRYQREKALKEIGQIIEKALNGNLQGSFNPQSDSLAISLASLTSPSAAQHPLATLGKCVAQLDPTIIHASFQQAFSRCYPSEALSCRYPDFPASGRVDWSVLLAYFGDGRGIEPELLSVWQQILAQPLDLAVSRQVPLALVLRQTGKTPDASHYAYATFVHQWGNGGYVPAGENGSLVIANGEDGLANGEDAVGKVAEILDRLLMSVRDQPVKPMVEIFAPLSLLEVAWLELLKVSDDWENRIPLREAMPFTIRSSDRLRMANKLPGLKDKHGQLLAGLGEWIPPDVVWDPSQLQAKHDDERLVALRCHESVPEAIDRERWLQAVVSSMVPLALWPVKGVELKESDLRDCLRELDLSAEESPSTADSVSPPADRPICPDLDALPRKRWQAQFTCPSLRQLNLLMETPDRLPLQAVLVAHSST